MKIVVNGNALVRSSLGVRRYFQQLMAEMQWPAGWHVEAPSSFSAIARLQETLMTAKTDEILWSPAHRGPLFASRHVVTVHDCINVEHVYSGDWRLPVLRMATQRLLRNAARVVAISNATKSAILKNYDVDPAQIIVIPSACRLPTFERVATDLSAEKVVRQNFILMVTNALPHKNASFAMKALASSTQMRKELTELKIVGQLAQGELESYQATGLPVTVQTRVSDDKLRDYYRSARFLLSPSLAEGHNLPIAEAICSGGNVVCSDIDVHREFYSGCAIFFDPHRVDSAVAAIDDALSRTTSWSSAGALPVRYFKEMASEYCDVFQSVH